ncbi:hypothetical protein SAMN05216345_11178 [Cupriavidus sp. YR651]|uniref:hypothetical protein n=1 Tax=Cupriavidus sp. YR651 TaxID=1855315 RepID=UPI0008822B0A|nr:hypothetical protein [Cupriavidus sp. YR651]SDD56917.1 hypothetical protein SAMN05216345_11178 [Cupriavidus sp. YR651]
MSLATLHTDARRLADAIIRFPSRFAAALFRVDPLVAGNMRVWLEANVRFENADVPPVFVQGGNAACFALVSIAMRKPALFWGALAAIPSLPVLILLKCL